VGDWRQANPLPWLLEPDDANPGVRYFTLRDLLDRPAGDPEIAAARVATARCELTSR
jgi:hypothetical protein